MNMFFPKQAPHYVSFKRGWLVFSQVKILPNHRQSKVAQADVILHYGLTWDYSRSEYQIHLRTYVLWTKTESTKRKLPKFITVISFEYNFEPK